MEAVDADEEGKLEAAANRGAQVMALTRNFIADAVEKAFPAVVNVAVDSGEDV